MPIEKDTKKKTAAPYTIMDLGKKWPMPDNTSKQQDGKKKKKCAFAVISEASVDRLITFCINE